ncbi:CPBP family intramembrane glutamic endopeptidase [uncultured Tateyamaria sp.]|uniref:CPBP family intramembrane glutamic endopeptidase n=1 Tax=Tateyamaria sp. 1078 TaxID=3417464 RepID=UPI002634BBB0|nr:CPBP family intramembrane glutamic endopeptidase [uncultured Tateyamaria sp.]
MSIWRLDYTAHATFVAPARAKAQAWRIPFGIVLVAAFFLMLSQMVFGTAINLMGPELAREIQSDGPLGLTAGAVLFFLLQLGLLGVAAAMVCVVLHRRRPMTLIGAPGPALRQFVAVSVVLALVVAALWVLPPYDIGGPLERNMALGRWLVLLPFGLVAVLIQVSAEEVLFRGYLQQQFAARFSSPFVWMFIPSAIFGALHYVPESAGSNAFTIALFAGVFGLVTADLTARAGTLGPAIAVHFSNNVQAILLTSPPDDMSGLALYLLPFGMGDEAQMAAWLPVDLGWMLVAWLAARLAIRR